MDELSIRAFDASQSRKRSICSGSPPAEIRTRDRAPHSPRATRARGAACFEIEVAAPRRASSSSAQTSSSPRARPWVSHREAASAERARTTRRPGCRARSCTRSRRRRRPACRRSSCEALTLEPAASSAGGYDRDRPALLFADEHERGILKPAREKACSSVERPISRRANAQAAVVNARRRSRPRTARRRCGIESGPGSTFTRPRAPKGRTREPSAAPHRPPTRVGQRQLA